MDPDQALVDLLDWARTTVATSSDAADLRAADHVLSMHEWLSKGGFLPQAWTDASMNGSDRGSSGL